MRRTHRMNMFAEDYTVIDFLLAAGAQKSFRPSHFGFSYNKVCVHFPKVTILLKRVMPANLKVACMIS